MQKYFLFLFCFVKYKSVEIFDRQVIWLAFINYKQHIYRVFKFLIWNVDWKNQLVFIAIQANANVVFRFNLAKSFYSNRKPNLIIIKIINKLFILLCNSVWMHFTGLICLTWHHKEHFWSLFLMLISPFLDFLIQQVIFHKNFLIMDYKLKC